MSKHNFLISDMYCCKCANKGITIPRKVNHYKEAGHLKKLYCPYCKQEWNHVEIRPIYSDYTYKDFQLEIRYGNFDKNGNRKEPYRIFRGELKQKGIFINYEN